MVMPKVLKCLNSLSKDKPQVDVYSVATWHTENSHLAFGLLV